MPGGMSGKPSVVVRRVPDRGMYDNLYIVNCNIDYANISGLLRLAGTNAAITIGAVPPTSATAGTGLWIDRTGLYGLNANTYQVKILASDGKLYAGGGNVKIDSGGITLNLLSSLLTWLPSGTGLMEDIYTISTPSANELQVYGSTLNNDADNVLSIEGFGTVSVNTPGYGDGDLRLAGGLYVGATNVDPVAGTIQLAEVSAPSAPAANNVIIYAVDNGSGKTQLMALFSSGAAQQLAIQP